MYLWMSGFDILLPFFSGNKMADTVLDLSSKSTSVLSIDYSKEQIKPENLSSSSPVARQTSSSDGNDSDSSLTGSAIRPVAGPVPSSLSCSPLRRPESPKTPPSAGLNRPFKSFTADSSVPSVFSPPTSPLLAPSQASGLPTMPVGVGLTSLYESSSAFPPFPLTPLTSHLLQRKRRAESRTSQSSSDLDSKKLKQVPEEKKDDSYWERRRKNNEAAKRSRDSRRQKEEEIAMRAAFLEQENLKLRAQVALLKTETSRLHYMLYNRL